MNWNDIQTELLELSNRILSTAIKSKPEDSGLDRRSASRLWFGDDFIACTRQQARSLDYYGGFEYVGPENRMEVGDLVLYSTQDSRVMDHWKQAHEDE